MSFSQTANSFISYRAFSFLAVPLLLLISGCSSYVSSHQGYSYGHHGHVSVGAHGNASGAAVVGALIVGGIIGSMINEAEHEKVQKEGELQKVETGENYRDGRHDELVNGYTIQTTESKSNDELYPDDNEQQDQQQYQQAINGNSGSMEWFQYGKDGNCYLMSVNSGVTDVVSIVDETKCQ